MNIITASTNAFDAPDLQDDLASSLTSLQARPAQLLICYYNPDVNQKALFDFLKPLAKHCIGASSCQGALCVDANRNHAKASAVIFALCDLEGNYGVASESLGDDSMAAGANAITQALLNAGRVNECPELIWCVMEPGCEEAVMQGIASVVGEHVPIVGGSSADNHVEGKWSQLADFGITQQSIVLAAMFPSGSIAHSFSSGYLPTQSKGRVTASEQRRLICIDNANAAEQYNQWIDGKVSQQLKGGSVLGATTLHPLGRVVANIDGVEQFVLSHPESINEDGELLLFSQLEVGDELVLMQGSTQSLIERASAVLDNAIALLEPDSSIKGALMVYCAGCMLHVGDDIQQVADSLLAEQYGFPIIATYTFGEQGCFLDGQSRHGNLMISALVFANA